MELLLAILILCLCIYYAYYRLCFTYWRRKKVPSTQPSFPFGDLTLSIWAGKQSVYVRLQELYNRFKNLGYRHGGIYFFNGPLYMPIDPELIKRILVTDFEYFVDRGMYGSERLPLSNHIFSMPAEKWRKARGKMSPNFTSGKLKSIYGIVQQHCGNLVRYLQVQGDETVVDLREILLRFTADVIGSTSFGIDCNSLTNPNSEFAQMVERISNHSRWELLRVVLVEGLQNPGNIEKIAYNDPVIEHFFTSLVQETIKYRDENHIVRRDFLNMLMELRATGMELKEIVAQSYLFFIAGFKTSALTMCYCLHELAQNQQIQEELRREIQANLGTTYEYEKLLELDLLDRVVNETMRKYPPLPMLNRVCVKPYEIPDLNVTLDQGTLVIIPLLGLHRDPDFFPDPLKFDPGRFSKDYNLVPFTYLPFGEGPRNCIGLRFGLVKVKLTIASILNNFRLLPSSNAEEHLTIDPSTTSILFNVVNGIHTKIVKL